MSPIRTKAISKGPGVLLASYAGQDARRLGAMTASKRNALTIQLASKVHPQLAKPDIVRQDQVLSWAWDNHPWSGRAFASYMPGQFADMHRHVVAADWEGRIHFVGEHCSRSHSWMQGALESAQIAAAMISS
jgi:monoamine oxidase